MKLLISSGSGGGRRVTVGLSGVGPPPTLIMSHVFAILMYGGALPSPVLTISAPEDRFVEFGGSLEVGYGEKVSDGKPLVRWHPIASLLYLYFVH